MNVPRPGGIPVHPMMVHFPLVAWTVATIAGWGALYDPRAGDIALWSNGAGLVFATLAVATGFIEFLDLPDQEQIQSVATLHMMLVFVAASVYGLSFLFQYKSDWLVATVVSTIGFGLIVFGAHQGARLVFQYGIPSTYKEKI